MELKAFNCVESDLQEFCEPRLVYLKSDVDKMIAELKDKCQMHDFFWDGCGFAKRGFKNTIAVSEAFDRLEAENRRLKRALWIAHAYKAKFKRWWLHLALDYEASMIRPDTKTIKRIKGKIENCEKSERKCRAKAEQYEEDK